MLGSFYPADLTEIQLTFSLDVGCGCGESLLLWATSYRPARMTGVTSLSAHREEAHRSLQASDSLPMDLTVEVIAEDAVLWTREKASEEPKRQDGGYDRIIALDCAYQQVFIAQSTSWTGSDSLWLQQLPY